MNTYLILVASLAIGCAPTALDISGEPSVDSGSDESIQTSGEENESDSSEGETELAQVSPGPWRTVDASIVNGDPCGFNEYLGSGNIAYRVEQYLPYSFDVQEGQGGFYIEASPYNTVRGPIFCALDGDRFECETQQVMVYDDWMYTIEFSGERLDTETITGTAVVQFEFDADTETLITSYGFEMAECDHAIDMTLAYGRF